jgi:hypothetical protein
MDIHQVISAEREERGKVRSLFPGLSLFVLLKEVGLNFTRFMKSRGLSNEPNMVVLSSRDSFSFVESELRNARVLINLKKLNLIKHLDLFLNSLVRLLPPDTSFVGYFQDDRIRRDEVAGLLEKNGFRTLDMQEMNGLTYFVSLNVGLPVEVE